MNTPLGPRICMICGLPVGQPRTVKEELRQNFTRALEAREELFPGIIGYDDTVIPEISLALLAGHDMLFLGEKGQGKSRLMRLLSRFLDDAIPYVDLPDAPAPRRSAFGPSRVYASSSSPRTTSATFPSPGGRGNGATPNGWHQGPSSPTLSGKLTLRSLLEVAACRPRKRYISV